MLICASFVHQRAVFGVPAHRAETVQRPAQRHHTCATKEMACRSIRQG